MGKGLWRWGKKEIIYLSIHCHHQSDESHFNVSVGSDGQSHKTVSTNHNLFEEKGEPKRYRTEVLPLTSLGQSGSHTTARINPWTYKLYRSMPKPLFLTGFRSCVQVEVAVLGSTS